MIARRLSFRRDILVYAWDHDSFVFVTSGTVGVFKDKQYNLNVNMVSKSGEKSERSSLKLHDPAST